MPEFSFPPAEGIPQPHYVAPEDVFSPERIMHTRLTDIEEGASSTEADLARQHAARTILKALGEPSISDIGPGVKIAHSTGDPHMQEGQTREAFVITRTLGCMVEREITNAEGTRIAAVLPAEWSDIEAAYKAAAPVPSQTQAELDPERLKIANMTYFHIDDYASVLNAMPPFRKAVVDRLVAESRRDAYIDEGLENEYLADFWTGITARPYVATADTGVSPFTPRHEAARDEDSSIVFPIGDNFVEMAYRCAPLHISSSPADLLTSADQLEITLHPADEQEPTRKVILTADISSAECGIYYVEYASDGTAIKILSGNSADSAETLLAAEQAVAKLRRTIALKAYNSFDAPDNL